MHIKVSTRLHLLLILVIPYAQRRGEMPLLNAHVCSVDITMTNGHGCNECHG